MSLSEPGKASPLTLAPSHVCRAFLEAGYRVRGAVAFASQGKYLKTLFETFGDNFQAVLVADMDGVGVLSVFCEYSTDTFR